MGGGNGSKFVSRKRVVRRPIEAFLGYLAHLGAQVDRSHTNWLLRHLDVPVGECSPHNSVRSLRDLITAWGTNRLVMMLLQRAVTFKLFIRGVLDLVELQ